ncbi:hypothetical protein D3C75_1090020 [compost metagenome]
MHQFAVRQHGDDELRVQCRLRRAGCRLGPLSYQSADRRRADIKNVQPVPLLDQVAGHRRAHLP